ncbi:MAG: (Fe-S)-binding protein [Lewinellaceae bacterium]|nr:(Fe-S)-binding protein [Saprospiraceae bacterium]MCB9329666.1 (Fe-S)-binding protein [Lewinellaceae bacterium]
MKVGLFIPCYIDQFYPQVGIATLELLEKLDVQVEFPANQTCCGQPLANSGSEQEAEPAYHHFVDLFHHFDHIVMPSGSCTYHVRKHYDRIEQTAEVQHVRKNTLDLSEFLLDVLNLQSLNARFPYKVGLHQSCHGLRGLRLGPDSEQNLSRPSKIQTLLNMVDGIELVDLSRPDECCGFGGTFAVGEPAISVKMGKDRIADHESKGVEVITAGDMSCLMHLEGIIRRQGKQMKVKHLAEILNGVQL